MAGRRHRGGGHSGLPPRTATGNELDKLRAQLLESLTSTISDTVDTVCEEFEESFAEAVQQLPPSSRGKAIKHAVDDPDAAMNPDYEMYYSCCQRLVNYIAANMDTAPDFVQQMDRIILACHSNASEHVLRSVVTKSLWFHRRDSKSGMVDRGDHSDDSQYGQEDDNDVDEDDDFRPPTRRAPPTNTRGTKRRAAPPPPARAARAAAPPPARKRARKEPPPRRSQREESEASDDGEEEEEEEDDTTYVRKRPARGRAKNRVDYSDEDEGGQQDEDDADVKDEATSQPHYAQADELLTFKDAIGDMCYADRRTPAQTRFFKERLRKAIQFVDAQLCKPPKGEVCAWECAKIRRQMCNRDLPCRNKICRLWHDVEAHTDRCQNTHCEFRIRVMLRETMYKIDHKKNELQDNRNELHKKKRKLLDLKHENLSDRESYVERRLLDNEIGQLEADIQAGEKELGVFKATKKAYWATLNEIGITEEDDVTDQFPEFHAHYTTKKTPAKKKPASKQTRRDDDDATAAKSSASSRAARSRRRQSDADSSNGQPIYSGPTPRRDRITRRSTQQSMQVMTNGVIELDDSDEDDEAEEHKSSEPNGNHVALPTAVEQEATLDESPVDPTVPGNENGSNNQDTRGDDVGSQDDGPASEDNEVDKEDEAPPQPPIHIEEEQSADYVLDEPSATDDTPAVPTNDSNPSGGPVPTAALALPPKSVPTSVSRGGSLDLVLDAPVEPSQDETSTQVVATHSTDDSGPLLPF